MQVPSAMLFASAALVAALGGAACAAPEDLARLQPETTPGFSNAGWKYDRYSDLPSLDANTAMVVADVQGPGVIRHIHTTRHHRPEITTRGVVLEIWFDDAETPAVMSPLGDFFGDGCNGKSVDFSTPLIECVPWAYNCYIPMPFEKHARVILRNDTDIDIMNYSYVEWEPLKEWDPSLAYFHATYARQKFQLTPETTHTFFETKGTGHLIGRQFSVVTEEPWFGDFGCVMEGNNEVDIDGQERAMDYLGTEDSFTFSWGFNRPFAGLRAGMPFIQKTAQHMLSIYRFHDYMPIRFSESLTWKIDWSHEMGFVNNPAWREAVDRGGCQMDYATVFYWYQNNPGGYEHQPLEPVAERGYVAPAPPAEPAPAQG